MTTTRDALRRNTQTKVLAAAATLFRARGFEPTTVRDIALEAKVSIGTVMSVGDKNALLVTIFDDGIEQLHVRRAQDPPAPRQILNLPCADRVFGLLQPFVQLFAEQTELARSYASILVAGKHASKVFTELAVVLKDEIAANVAVQNGGCATDPWCRAEAVYLAYLGLLFTWSADAGVTGAENAAPLGERLRETLVAFCSCQEDN